MNLDITGRNFAITETLRQTVENRLTQLLERQTLKITSVKVVLSIEKGRCTADVLLAVKEHELTASATGYDMYQAVDEAIARADRQVGRLLDRMRTRKVVPMREAAPADPLN